MKASRDIADFTQRTLMSLMTEQADLAQIPGHTITSQEDGEKKWIMYPVDARAEIEKTIRILVRSLANAYGIPASYPLG
jgi:hypothetical protein